MNSQQTFSTARIRNPIKVNYHDQKNFQVLLPRLNHDRGRILKKRGVARAGGIYPKMAAHAIFVVK
jgi:hypothetical protein